MKKILIVIITKFEPYDGIASVMLNYYRAMDKTDVLIDFASVNELCPELARELETNKSTYYNLGDRKKNIWSYLYNFKKILKAKSYDAIHVNGNSATMALELILAKQCRVQKRIAHGHASKSDHPMLHRILEPFFENSYTDSIAVSRKSGDWLYGKNYMVLNNAIDTKKYGFCLKTRMAYRRKYGIENAFVIGNVGRLNSHKNHVFLLRVFKEILKEKGNAKLVIAGGGVLEDFLVREATRLGIADAVLFLGMLNDTSDVLQAMDVFVFPSKVEGLGMALIEAQASGLECVASDSIPIETKVSDYVHYKSLNDSYKEWACEILKIDTSNREIKSSNARASIAKTGYEISKEAEKLRRIYLK